MSITKEQLEDHIKKGLVSDIFKMERSYFLLRKISDNSAQINEPNSGNYGDLFGTLQQALEAETIMAIARLYDNPSNRYPTRCIRGLLSFIEENIDSLPKIVEKHNLELHLEHIHVPKEIISLVQSNDREFILAFVNYYQNLLNGKEIMEIVEKLKTLRDKTIAHNEMVSPITGPTWGSLERILEISKDLSGVLGWAYLSTVYVHNGEYILSSDAERPARALTRMLNDVYSNK